MFSYRKADCLLSVYDVDFQNFVKRKFSHCILGWWLALIINRWMAVVENSLTTAFGQSRLNPYQLGMLANSGRTKLQTDDDSNYSL